MMSRKFGDYMSSPLPPLSISYALRLINLCYSLPSSLHFVWRHLWPVPYRTGDNWYEICSSLSLMKQKPWVDVGLMKSFDFLLKLWYYQMQIFESSLLQIKIKIHFWIILQNVLNFYNTFVYNLYSYYVYSTWNKFWWDYKKSFISKIRATPKSTPC